MNKDLRISVELQRDKDNILNKIMNSTKQQPISSVDFGIPDGRVRKIVHMLRLAGEPICTIPGGYYYAETAQDIDDTIEYLERLRGGIDKTLSRLYRVFVEYKVGGK